MDENAGTLRYKFNLRLLCAVAIVLASISCAFQHLECWSEHSIISYMTWSCSPPFFKAWNSLYSASTVLFQPSVWSHISPQVTVSHDSVMNNPKKEMYPKKGNMCAHQWNLLSFLVSVRAHTSSRGIKWLGRCSSGTSETTELTCCHKLAD